MKIYVDFDDCISETARYFTALVAEMFGRNVPYEEITCFDLDKSFSLTKEQFEEMMIKAHKPEALLSYEETPGARQTINSWIDEGHEVYIITGRPSGAYEASRKWLDGHGMERVKLFCLNKYGHDSFYRNREYGLELEDYYKMHFDYAIEDSPKAFRFFEHLPELKVLVIDRPWNQDCEFPGDNYTRVFDWKAIKEIVAKGNKA